MSLKIDMNHLENHLNIQNLEEEIISGCTAMVEHRLKYLQGLSLMKETLGLVVLKCKM